MGLAASQARLLTITSRKSRAQFESMRLSHQKLALSRNLTEISNEYQNSLDKTKLYYDFYGVNSTDTPLTYNMLMSPSSLNDYTPTLISNNQGQIVLSTPYAEAARAAGIPQEGLGCTPSSLMRDAFIMNLAEQGIITQNTADAISAIPYNQGAGLGSDNLINTVITTGGYDQLRQLLKGIGTTSAATLVGLNDLGISGLKVCDGIGGARNNTGINDLASVTLDRLLNGDPIYLGIEGNTGGGGNQLADLENAVNSVITQLGTLLSSNLVGADDAIAYANSKMQSECWGNSAVKNDYKYGQPSGWNWGGMQAIFNLFDHIGDGEIRDMSCDVSENVLAMCHSWGREKVPHKWVCGNPKDYNSVDLSAFTQGWFTYFMQYMMGLGSANSNNLSVRWAETKDKSKFANENNIGDFQFTLSTTTVSDNEALISNFYDTLFNQICINGWTENKQVATDSNYLKEMLQTGQMYVTSMADDYYYYQNNYSTNNFIKEVSDDAAIAQAESKYTTEKARINAKEQELDLKMKNLDTEISSLETEYEAVKKVIEGNVSKSFTRYES